MKMMVSGWLIWVLPEEATPANGEAELLPLQWAQHREVVLLPQLAVERIDALRKKSGQRVRFLPVGVFTDSEILVGPADESLPPKYEADIAQFLARTRR